MTVEHIPYNSFSFTTLMCCIQNIVVVWGIQDGHHKVVSKLFLTRHKGATGKGSLKVFLYSAYTAHVCFDVALQ